MNLSFDYYAAERKIYKIEQLTGLNIDVVIKLLEAGCILKAPEYMTFEDLLRRFVEE